MTCMAPNPFTKFWVLLKVLFSPGCLLITAASVAFTYHTIMILYSVMQDWFPVDAKIWLLTLGTQLVFADDSAMCKPQSFMYIDPSIESKYISWTGFMILSRFSISSYEQAGVLWRDWFLNRDACKLAQKPEFMRKIYPQRLNELGREKTHAGDWIIDD